MAGRHDAAHDLIGVELITWQLKTCNEGVGVYFPGVVLAARRAGSAGSDFGVRKAAELTVNIEGDPPLPLTIPQRSHLRVSIADCATDGPISRPF